MGASWLGRLYRAGRLGCEVKVRFDAEGSGELVFGAEFDVDGRLAVTPDWTSTVLSIVQSPLPGVSGSLVCGECAHGSEGYFARLDSHSRLLWVVYQTESNPFVQARVDGSVAVFTNNLDQTVAVDLNSAGLMSS